MNTKYGLRGTVVVCATANAPNGNTHTIEMDKKKYPIYYIFAYFPVRRLRQTKKAYSNEGQNSVYLFFFVLLLILELFPHLSTMNHHPLDGQ